MEEKKFTVVNRKYRAALGEYREGKCHGNHALFNAALTACQDNVGVVKHYFSILCEECGKTVQGTDVLFPQIGEIIGGSVREESYDKLMNRIQELNIPMKDMWWYLDTRKYGSCPHAGFGLGFERLLLFVTGMANIRDVIPFPRTPRNAEF